MKYIQHDVATKQLVHYQEKTENRTISYWRRWPFYKLNGLHMLPNGVFIILTLREDSFCSCVMEK